VENREFASGIEIVEQALSNGNFDSLHEDEFRRFCDSCRSNPEAYYHTVEKESGHDAAEAWLIERFNDFSHGEVADALPTIASGIAKLLATGSSELQIKSFSNTDDRSQPEMFPISPFGAPGSVRGFALRNRIPRNVNTPRPSGSGLFGPYGALELVAFCVTVNHLQPDENDVSILFPHGLNPDEFHYSYITLKRDGKLDCGGREISMVWRRNVDSAINFAFAGKLEHRVTSILGGHVNDCLGFLGAEDYLVKHIGKLGPYLHGIADLHQSAQTDT
jgi:hypothetical protein